MISHETIQVLYNKIKAMLCHRKVFTISFSSVKTNQLKGVKMENILLNSLKSKNDSLSSILKTMNTSERMGMKKTTSMLLKSLASSSQSYVSESLNSTSVNSTTLSSVTSVTSTSPSSISSTVSFGAKYEWSGVVGLLDWNKSKILNIITSQIQNTTMENPNMDQHEENELDNEDDIYENFEAPDAREVWPIFSRNIK